MKKEHLKIVWIVLIVLISLISIFNNVYSQGETGTTIYYHYVTTASDVTRILISMDPEDTMRIARVEAMATTNGVYLTQAQRNDLQKNVAEIKDYNPTQYRIDSQGNVQQYNQGTTIPFIGTVGAGWVAAAITQQDIEGHRVASATFNEPSADPAINTNVASVSEGPPCNDPCHC